MELGAACSAHQDKVFRNLKCRRLQCDEIWSFCYAKAKNVPEQFKGEFGYGDVWTWTAIDAQTKLVPCWYVGRRDASAAYHFMHDLAERLAHRVQLTTDGHRAYIEAVEDAFGANIDYAMLVKIYGNEPATGEVRYSPAVCMGARRAVISGRPDHAHVSTSFAKRQNLTMRMSMRRFTRLTNGAFQRSWRIWKHRLRSISCITTSAVFTKRYDAPRPWKLAFPITSGLWRKLLVCFTHE